MFSPQLDPLLREKCPGAIGNTVAASFLLLCSFVAQPKMGRTRKVGRRERWGARAFAALQTHTSIMELTSLPFLSLLASLTHTILVTLNVRQPILCHFQGPVQ